MASLAAATHNVAVNAQRAIVPLSGLDGLFLDLETPETPMHVGSLHVFAKSRRPRDFCSAVKRALAGRLHVAPIFGRRLAAVPLNLAHPVWVDGDKIDLDFHVRRVRLPAPGTLAQLEDCVAGLHAQLMDRSRPLWMLYVLDGLQDGRGAYYIKIHHAVLDGAAGVGLATVLFDVAPKRRGPAQGAGRAGRSGAAPGAIAVAGAALSHDAGQFVRLLRYLPTAASALANMIQGPAFLSGKQLRRNFSFGPRTPLNVTIGPERSLAVLSLPLDEVKAIGKAENATINDVVLALCAATLRRYLARHGGVPRKPLTATMPISLREPGDVSFGIHATLSLVRLPTNLADPLRRLHSVRAAAGATKSLAQRAKALIPTDFPSIGLPWLVHSLATLYGKSHVADLLPPIANVAISNVPGPQVPLYTLGRRMEAYWPLSIVEHGIGLNITVVSYSGALGFGFTAARCAVPDARELAHDLAAAHAELRACTAQARRRRSAGTGRRRGSLARGSRRTR